ncbi:MAG: ABC transporter permease [Actinomycetota bacterium]|nr:ABC transporter permease [Actinomycetota bacterium]
MSQTGRHEANGQPKNAEQAEDSEQLGRVEQTASAEQAASVEQAGSAKGPDSAEQSGSVQGLADSDRPASAEEAARTEGQQQPGFLTELWDAISVRTVTLVVGVLVLQLGFILSYVGAFHSPTPHRIPVSVVAPAQVAPQLIGQLNGIPGNPLHAVAVTDQAAARSLIARGSSAGALLVNPAGKTDTLLVASAGGTSTSGALEQVITAAETSQQRSATVQDVVGLQAGDGRGLTGFYLVIGWIVGGYLVASLLGVAKGARPATVRRAVIRLLAVIPYAIVSGLGGAVIVGPVLGALTGHLMALWWLGALLVFAAASVTMAFQVLFGVLGIGVTVLVFVVLGNPSAGGAYQASLLPPFWRAISSALPNGAGTDSVRRIVYFQGHGIGGHLILITVYAILGAAVAIVASGLRQHRATGQPVT